MRGRRRARLRGRLAAPAAPWRRARRPVLVVTNPADPFGRYYAEILRAEGLNAFAVADIGSAHRRRPGAATRSSCSPGRGQRRPGRGARRLGRRAAAT